MKRSHIIERLLVLCDSQDHKRKLQRELEFKSNENLLAIYESARPRLEAHREQLDRVIRREKRRQQRLEAAQLHEEACNAWSRGWRHPRVQYPLSPIRPRLEFGLVEFWQTALYLLQRQGDQDAAATLRVIGTPPDRFSRTRKFVPVAVGSEA